MDRTNLHKKIEVQFFGNLLDRRAYDKSTLSKEVYVTWE